MFWLLDALLDSSTLTWTVTRVEAVVAAKQDARRRLATGADCWAIVAACALDVLELYDAGVSSRDGRVLCHIAQVCRLTAASTSLGVEA